jgi:hypothetical protein
MFVIEDPTIIVPVMKYARAVMPSAYSYVYVNGVVFSCIFRTIEQADSHPDVASDETRLYVPTGLLNDVNQHHIIYCIPNPAYARKADLA